LINSNLTLLLVRYFSQRSDASYDSCRRKKWR